MHNNIGIYLLIRDTEYMPEVEQKCFIHEWEICDVSRHNLLPSFGAIEQLNLPLEARVSFNRQMM